MFNFVCFNVYSVSEVAGGVNELVVGSNLYLFLFLYRLRDYSVA